MWPGRPMEAVPEGAGVGPIDSPLPTEAAEPEGVSTWRPALSDYDRLLVQEVATLVVAEVWHLLRLAGVVVDPPVRRAVSGGLGRATRSSPYGRGATGLSPRAAPSGPEVVEHLGGAMVASLAGEPAPSPTVASDGGASLAPDADELEEEVLGLWDVAARDSPRPGEE